MARKSNKSGKAKAKKAAKPAPQQEEVLEEVDTGGFGIDEGILVTTFALLAGAVFMVYTLLNERFPDPIS